MPVEGFELPDPDELQTTSARRLALVAAAIALVGVGVVVLHARASVEEARSFRGAQLAHVDRWSTSPTVTSSESRQPRGLLGATAQWLGDAAVQREWAELEQRRVTARRLAVILGPTDPGRTRVYTQEAETWQRIRDEIASLSDIPDPFDPNIDYWSAYSVAGEAARLRSVAAEEQLEAWGSRADAYVTVLAFVAAALLLTGVGLAYEGTARRVLELCGATVGLGCLVSAMWLATRPIPETPEEAQAAVVDGEALKWQAFALLRTEGLANASEALDLLGRAQASYGHALALREDYSEAFLLRGQTRLDAASIRAYVEMGAEYLPDYVTMYDPRDLARARADLERALDVGSDASSVYTGVAITNYLTGDYERGLWATDQAIARNPDAAFLWMNRGANLLMMQEYDAALGSYRKGLRFFEEDPDRPDRKAFMEASRNELERITSSGEVPKRVVDRVRDLITLSELRTFTGSEQVPTPPADADFTVTAVRSAPAAIQIDVVASSIPEDIPVHLSVYYRPVVTAKWDNIANVAYPEWPDGATSVPVYPSRNWCPSGGHYRVDAYVGSRRLTSFEEDLSDLPDRTWFWDRLLGGGACRPADWDVTVDPDTHWVTFTHPSQSQVVAVAAADGVPGDLRGLDLDQLLALEAGLPTMPYSLRDLLRDGLVEQRSVNQWTVGETVIDGTAFGVAYTRSSAGAPHWILWAFPNGADAMALQTLRDSVTLPTATNP